MGVQQSEPVWGMEKMWESRNQDLSGVWRQKMGVQESGPVWGMETEGGSPGVRTCLGYGDRRWESRSQDLSGMWRQKVGVQECIQNIATMLHAYCCKDIHLPGKLTHVCLIDRCANTIYIDFTIILSQDFINSFFYYLILDRNRTFLKMASLSSADYLQLWLVSCLWQKRL